MENERNDRNELLFNNYFVHFLEVLREASDESHHSQLEHCFLKYQKYVKTKRVKDYLIHLLGRFQVHIKLIAEQDDFLFSPEYHQGNLRLISGIDLVNIWEGLHNISEEKRISFFKKEIWTGLTNIYISTSLALGQKEAENPWPKRIIKNIRLQRQIEQELEEEPDEDSEEAGFNPMLPDISQIENIFKADNPLAIVLNDMKDDLNPETFLQTLNPEGKQNPMEVLTSLFSPDNQGLQTIVQTLGDKFNEKMKARGYDEKDMETATAKMQEDFASMPGMEMLNGLFQQPLSGLGLGADGTGTGAGTGTSAGTGTGIVNGAGPGTGEIPPDMQQALQTAFSSLQGLVPPGQEQGEMDANLGQALNQDPEFAAQLEQMKAGFGQFIQNFQQQAQEGQLQHQEGQLQLQEGQLQLQQDQNQNQN